MGRTRPTPRRRECARKESEPAEWRRTESTVDDVALCTHFLGAVSQSGTIARLSVALFGLWVLAGCTQSHLLDCDDVLYKEIWRERETYFLSKLAVCTFRFKLLNNVFESGYVCGVFATTSKAVSIPREERYGLWSFA